MRFDWDDDKNRENLAKHGVSFELAVEVFDDPFHLSDLDRVVNEEERWWAIGRLENQALLVVVHAYRDEGEEEIIRIISARKATRSERRLYEEET